MKKRFSEEQIIGFLREADAGMPVKDVCRRHGFSEASYYLWRGKYGGLSVSEAKRLKALEAENAKLKKLLAEAMLEQEVTREVLLKKVVTAPARREAVRGMTVQGLTERQALRMVGMSASSLRYRPAPDRNIALREGDPGAGPPASALRRRHDLPEAPPTGRDRQPQTRRAALYRGQIAAAPAQTQEGAGRGSPAPGAPRRRQRGLVHGLRVRPQRRRTGDQVPHHRR